MIGEYGCDDQFLLNLVQSMCGMKIRQNLQTALATVAILWLVFFINLALPMDLRLYGLRPRHLDSLVGIILTPFLHVDLRHLIANSGALFVLLTVSLSFSRKLTFRALWIIILAGGGLVWLLGKSGTIHIGASGIIFGLIGFLISLGIFRRDWKALIISLVVLLLYGGALQSLFIYVPGISWTGHLFGFLAGVLAAWWMRAARKR
jgi:membrane associated rhomboid family serine protease